MQTFFVAKMTKMADSKLEVDTGRILIVDDSPESLRVLSQILRARGHEVYPAKQGELAIKAAQAAPPELILLDVVMPGMDGYEVCRQLKEDGRLVHIPVIFISGRTDSVDKVKGFSLGAVDFVTKPFAAEEVLARVDTHLKVHRYQLALSAEIEERKRVELALREAEAVARKAAEIADLRFFDAMDSMPDMVRLYDSDDRVIYQNIVARQQSLNLIGHDVLGVTFEEFHRALLSRGLLTEAVGREEEWLKDCMQRHRNPPGVSRMQVIDTTNRWHEMRELRTPDGGTLVITVDITESVEREEQLRQAQKMEAVGQLTAGVAHDFNNLLLVISGNAELLADELGAEHSRLSALMRAARRGAELTQRLLAFSRKQVLRPETLNANELIADITDLLRRTLGEHIDIETNTAAELWNCEVDSAQLENALINLAINARDAMPSGGKLTMETANAPLDDQDLAAQADINPGQYVMLGVTDTGCGVSPKNLKHVFEPFFTTKPVGSGSGLGLSMVYGFIKQSKGHVSIDSEEGKGTTIKLYLPRSVETETVKSKQAREDVPGARGETVLLVEDDADVRDFTVFLLSGLGYRTIEAANGAEALELLKTADDVNLLVTDVVLSGGMNGSELAAEAKRRLPGTRVLFMSGYTENALGEQSRLDADAEFLQKPFNRDDFARALRRLLDS